jgi:hypothetical protein
MAELIAVLMKQLTDRRRRDVHAMGRTATETVCGRPEADIVSVMLDQDEAMDWFDWTDGLYRPWYATCADCESATQPELVEGSDG